MWVGVSQVGCLQRVLLHWRRVPRGHAPGVCVRERERASESESESKSESKREREKLFSGPYVSSLRLIVAYDARGCYEVCCNTS